MDDFESHGSEKIGNHTTTVVDLSYLDLRNTKRVLDMGPVFEPQSVRTGVPIDRGFLLLAKYGRQYVSRETGEKKECHYRRTTSTLYSLNKLEENVPKNAPEDHRAQLK